jgi:hypothetical protein
MEMMIGGVWTDITDDVRLTSAHSGGGVKITRGTPNEGNVVEPTEMTFVLNNAGGKYSPRNEASPNYGLLGQNTPVRFAASRRTAGFGTTAVDGWGRLDTWIDRENVSHLGDYWRIIGSAANFDVSGGTGTIQANSGLQFASFGLYGDCEILTRVKVSNLTSEFGVMLRVRNPIVDAADFESGPGDWQPFSGTLVGTSTQAHTGTSSALFTVVGSPSSAHARSTEKPVLAGRTYRARGWMRCSVARDVQIVINWHKAGGVASTIKGSSVTTITVAANTWTLFEVTDSAPDDAVTCYYGGTMTTSPAAGTLLFHDDFELFEVDNMDYYSAGLLPGSPDKEFLRKVSIGNGSSSLSRNQPSNIVINQYYWIKAQMSGIKRRMRLWQDGTTEPTTWDIVGSETNAATQGGNPPKTGMVGVYALGGTAVVTFDSVQVNVWRAHAEITKLPPRWDLSRQDQWVPIIAKGPLRRRGQGRKEIESSTTLYFKSYTSTMRAWSPLDSFTADGRTVPNLVNNATTPVARNLALGTPDATGTFAAPGLSGFADFHANDSYLAIRATPGATPNKWSYFNYIRMENAPASDVLLYQVQSSGTATLWKVFLQLDRQARIEAYSSTGTLLASGVAAFYLGTSELPYGAWMAANLYVFSSAGTVSWAFNYHCPSAVGFYTINGTFAGSAGTCGGATYQSTAVHTAAGNMQVAQALVYPGDLPFVTADFARSAAAYEGEDAIARWKRLGGNDSIPLDTTQAFAAVGKLLGQQQHGKTLELMAAAAEMDGSFQMEQRDDLALNLRTRDSLWNQTPVTLKMDLGHMTEPLEPTDDDQTIVNDVTAKRTNGGSARSIQTTGLNNVNDPEVDPQGVGTYPTTPELAYNSDDQMQEVADWRRAIGTLDELRFTSITALFHSEPYDDDPDLTAALMSCDTGDVLELFVTEVSKEPTLQMIQKYEETIDQYEWTWTAVTQPAIQYNVGVLGKTARLAATGTTVNTSFLSGTDTDLKATVAAGNPLWCTPKDDGNSFPFHILVDGCRLRVRSVGKVLNANPYFDTDTTGWDLVGSSTNLYWEQKIGFTRTLSNPAGKLTINPCARVTSGAAASDTGISSSSASQAAVTVGETVRISAWIKPEVTANVVCQGIFYDGSSVFVSAVTPTLVSVTGGTWYHFSADIVVPASAVFMRVRAIAVLSTGQSVWLDDIRMMKPATYLASPQTLQVDQVPTYGVIKTLGVGKTIQVAHPWRLAW